MAGAYRVRAAQRGETARFFRAGGKPATVDYNGLLDIARYAGGEDVAIIHDAARPMVSEELISACLNAVAGHDSVMPVLPMTDTVYDSADGKHINRLLERERIFAGQAPEAFRLGAYLGANERLLPDAILKINGSTEPAILVGLDVVTVPGDRSNFTATPHKTGAKGSQLM